MAHSSLEMGLNLGMRAAETAQRRGESEKDRKMRKLMAKEQRDFTKEMAVDQRKASTASAKLLADARVLETKADHLFKTGQQTAAIKAQKEAADKVRQAQVLRDQATAQERADHAEYRQTSLDMQGKAAAGTRAAQAAAALARNTEAGVSAAHQKGMLALAQSAEQRLQNKADKPPAGGLHEFDEFNKGDNDYADRIQTIDTELSGLAAHVPGHLPRMTKLRSEREKLVAAKQLHNQKYFKAAQATPPTATIRDSIDGLTGQPSRTITRTVPASSLPSLTGPGLGGGNNQGYSPNPPTPRRLNFPDPPPPSANPVVPPSIRGTDEEPKADPFGIRPED